LLIYLFFVQYRKEVYVVDMPLVFLVVSGVAWIVYVGWLSRAVNQTVDNLYELFLKDKNRWWLESELQKCVGRTTFVTSIALKLLHQEVGLQFQPLVIWSIYSYTREGTKYSAVVFLVRLGNEGGPRKKKKEVVRVKRPAFRQIPVCSAPLHSLRS
jgi:hypothetical protein